MMQVDWQRRASLARWVVALNYVLLLLLVAAQTLVWPGPGREPNVTIWILQTLPLLVVMPGIWRGGVRAHAWLSFIAMLYFAAAVANLPLSNLSASAAATSVLPALRWLNVLEVILSVELFVGAMLYVRWRSRAVRATTELQEF